MINEFGQSPQFNTSLINEFGQSPQFTTSLIDEFGVKDRGILDANQGLQFGSIPGTSDQGYVSPFGTADDVMANLLGVPGTADDYGYLPNTSTSMLPANNLVAFEPGTKLDRTLKNLYSGYENLGIKDPNLVPLMEQDLKENKEKGTPLSLPKNAYTLVG